MKTQKYIIISEFSDFSPFIDRVGSRKIDFKTKKMVMHALQLPFGLSIANRIVLQIQAENMIKHENAKI